MGKDYRNIHKYANGYAAYLCDVDGRATLTDHIELAGMSATKAVVVEAVAEARGISVGQARKKYTREIKAVREAAEEEAERRGTTVEQEVKTIAQGVVAAASQVEGAGTTPRRGSGPVIGDEVTGQGSPNP